MIVHTCLHEMTCSTCWMGCCIHTCVKEDTEDYIIRKCPHCGAIIEKIETLAKLRKNLNENNLKRNASEADEV